MLQKEHFSVFRIHRSSSANRKPISLNITNSDNYHLDPNCWGQVCRIKVRWDIEANRLIFKEFTEFVNLDPNFKPSKQPKTDAPTITDTQPSNEQPKANPPETTPTTVTTPPPPQHATIEAAYVAAANGQLVFKMGKRMIKTQGQLPNAKMGNKYRLKLEKQDDGLFLIEAKRL